MPLPFPLFKEGQTIITCQAKSSDLILKTHLKPSVELPPVYSSVISASKNNYGVACLMCFVTLKHFTKLKTNNEILVRDGFFLLQSTTANQFPQPLITWSILYPSPCQLLDLPLINAQL